MRVFWIAFFWVGFVAAAQGQAKELFSPLAVVDDIQIDLKDVYLSPKGDTVTMELFLISLQKNPREFKMNTFSSGIINSAGKLYFYDTIEMGNVHLSLADRQNYLHYFMQQDLPVLLRIKTADWSKNWGRPQQAKITFEDSTEEGKFLEVELKL